MSFGKRSVILNNFRLNTTKYSDFIQRNFTYKTPNHPSMKRRTFVKHSSITAFSVAAFGAIHWNGKSFEGDTETTTDILGPFYRPGAPMRSDLIPKGSSGQVMHLSGTIFQKDGKTPSVECAR